MICFHKKHNWLARTKDGREAVIFESTWYFAREKACSVLNCEREDILEINEQEEKRYQDGH